MYKRDVRERANISPQSRAEGGHDLPDSEQNRVGFSSHLGLC